MLERQQRKITNISGSLPNPKLLLGQQSNIAYSAARAIGTGNLEDAVMNKVSFAEAAEHNKNAMPISNLL